MRRSKISDLSWINWHIHDSKLVMTKTVIVTTKFNHNYNSNSTVPADIIKRSSQREGDDKFWLTFKVPDTILVLKYTMSAETRRKVYYGNKNRMNENIPLFQEFLLLWHEAAQLLGYPNHTALRISDKMVEAPEVVNQFLEDLHRRLVPRGREEIKMLLEFKKAHPSPESCRTVQLFSVAILIF